LLKVVFYHLKGWQKPTISFYRHSTVYVKKHIDTQTFSISREVNIRPPTSLLSSWVSTKSSQVENRMKQAAKGVHMLVWASDSLATHFVR